MSNAKVRVFKCAVCGKKITGIMEPRESGYGYGNYVACSWTCQRQLENMHREKDLKRLDTVKKQKKYAVKPASAENMKRIAEMRKAGMGAQEIADATGMSITTVYNSCKLEGVPFGEKLRNSWTEKAVPE